MKNALFLMMLLVLFPTEVDMLSASSVQNHNIQIVDGNSTPLHVNQTTATAKKSKRRKRKQNTTASASSRQTKPAKVGVQKKPTKASLQKNPAKASVQSGQESATLRRIKREWKEAVKMGIAYDWAKMKNVAAENDENYSYVRMGPYGSNLLKWHFSVMGPPNSEFDGGIYHGRVLLPKDYPGSPPRVQVLTPSGRFIPGHDICLSASNYHPESWTPQWTVLSLIEALRLHMVTQANEIGGASATPTERRKYARASRLWSMGKINHPMMISQGVFGWNDSSDITPTDSELSHRPLGVEERESGVHLVASRTAEYLPSDRSLTVQMTRAALELFRSPPRLAILMLFALFVMLNLKP
mmetsp:Transcript_27375/g.45571  ORF Transcript_27375/g.45571 Transcript_27375/m.45571 type:complete len:355 (+) Transcript_27375:204-1268(+)|eukprot:CAMPEP_0119027218 /NCGR_PEP_ID=MMETSP1176-20130426/36727_1 /TAXON_ID=265551 /ORGANISM="Synedropsis recta cf, Strain CCMP1620" /LENGTH=354 /DNA_ID=CAMNT_0006983083 /DNA_START=151 /DNA_END=1215 /DNA_ORIENTATION=+